MKFELNGVQIYYGEKKVDAAYLGDRWFYGKKPTKYVMAKDDDFSGTKNGEFKYIGTEPYVEIPHVIKGVNVTSYKGMFMGTNVLGVRSTNKNITTTYDMFAISWATEIEMDTSSLINTASMFQTSYATTLDLSKFDMSNVKNVSRMFLSSKAKTIYAKNQSDISKIKSSDALLSSGTTVILKP